MEDGASARWAESRQASNFSALPSADPRSPRPGRDEPHQRQASPSLLFDGSCCPRSEAVSSAPNSKPPSPPHPGWYDPVLN
jgi:hypothetical protein